MKNYEFVVWLEGYLDLCQDSKLTKKKLRIIRNHLNLVKAVEGSLGPLNQEIYDAITAAIDKNDFKEIKSYLTTTIESFLKESFPDSQEDNQ